MDPNRQANIFISLGVFLQPITDTQIHNNPQAWKLTNYFISFWRWFQTWVIPSGDLTGQACIKTDSPLDSCYYFKP